jgi:hypothetical protein
MVASAAIRLPPPTRNIRLSTPDYAPATFAHECQKRAVRRGSINNSPSECAGRHAKQERAEEREKEECAHIVLPGTLGFAYRILDWRTPFRSEAVLRLRPRRHARVKALSRSRVSWRQRDIRES